MDIQVSALGAVLALAISIFLIIKKIQPAYALIIGALIGGLIGGANLTDTVTLMMNGAKGMMTAILRILTAGVLAGVLIQSGAATKIAETIISKLGQNRALIALTISTMVLTAVGVFVDVAVITVAPISLEIARKSNITKSAILLAMIGGGKAGNIISPNPNTIAVSENLNVSLTSVMIAGIIPAILGVVITCIISKRLTKKGTYVEAAEVIENNEMTPSFLSAITGPLVSIGLLMLRPIANISIDPLIALPVGGIIGVIAMGKLKKLNEYASFGLSKMTGVAILLIGTGTLAGIISNSALKDVIISGINTLGLPSFALAPISGILMAGATASTTSGAAVASSVFGSTITSLGVSSLATAAMIHAALIGGLIGGANLTDTVTLMMNGAKGMMTAILRILTAGVLAGVLIQSGAATKIAETIISKLGQNRALIALTISTMVLTAVGVFVDVAVITVAPISLEIARKSNITKSAILLAMIGGGKAGNIISPNPNTIAVSENLNVSLTSVMIAGIIPAILGVVITCIISKRLTKKGTYVEAAEVIENNEMTPSFLSAITGPLVSIGLLMLRPIANISIDPLIALPVGGIIGVIAMGKLKKLNEYASFGLSKMTGVAILLIGTGTLAGIISNSALKDVIISGINTLGLPSFALAPIDRKS
ncbi:hypothetical protein ClosIBUN22A_CONTIG10g00228, partial [Clostridium sp. IBUN22A]